ncbi:MAG: glycosyltransferase family 2 protein [bacterium]|nr:glycosyltransferase family 2 protein [bacterium]
MPRVSIGLPVYNYAQFVGNAIEGVLAQTFEDFELIICDNASTDRTGEICQRYAERDARIQYHRHPENIGAAANFNSTFEKSSGEYFKWLAADDGIEPGFLEKAVAVLDADPTVEIACSWYYNRDEARDETLPFDADHSLTSDHAYPRLRTLLERLPCPLASIWGLYRRDTLQQTELIRPIVGADTCLLVDLALKGRTHQIPEHLLFFRDHNEAYHYIRRKTDHREGRTEAAWFDPTNRARTYYPYWRRMREYMRSAWRCDAPRLERIRMVLYIPRNFARKYRSWMIAELFEGLGLYSMYRRLARLFKRPAPSTSQPPADS